MKLQFTLILCAFISGSALAVPVLNSMEIEKVAIDVSSGPQIVTFTLDVSDEAGIDWARSCLCRVSSYGYLMATYINYR